MKRQATSVQQSQRPVQQSHRSVQRKHTDAQLRAARAAFPALRLKWIDRVAAAIDAYPGAPPATEVSRAAKELYRELAAYREGFVAALNLTEKRP